MGALHDGHRSLFDAARAENETVVASLFVNPAQFGEQADLAAYPARRGARRRDRSGRRTSTCCSRRRGEEMYPAGFGTWVDVDGARRRGSGARPGHFRGVATVCLKLFNIVQPRRAYFGQKDAQQGAVVRRIVRDLHLRRRDPRAADRARPRRARLVVAQRAALARRAGAGARAAARAPRRRRRVRPAAATPSPRRARG